ncbi:Rab11 family-interacting protein 3-like [Homarus americanus]|uniref:Rab11 family-interacting protein 3-like n=1 Tax=Homarus americanus TaxID=6706 RepID=A0A8J5KF98_HOMAM|nr:Rab11 family-interacting protein 3-like [Homarus americanus]
MSVAAVSWERAAKPPKMSTEEGVSKDPMRDSLMSSSSSDEFSDDEDNENNNTPIPESFVENNLDLEFDLWQGQFEITKPRYSNGHAFYKDIVKTVQMLQQQVGVLAENQVNSDDRFSRVKQDNAAYHERVVMLEEQLRETELRHEDRHAEEQRRNRELITRIEREKELIIENISIKLTSVEKDNTAIDNECKRFKSQVEKLQKDKELLEDWASEAEFSASALHQENSKLAELSRREKEEMKVIEELRCEIERLRTAEETARKRSPSVDPQTTQSAELQATIRQLREENKNLVEQVEDLQAQLLTTRLEEGRTLVTATNNNSLAAEFEAMTSEELKKSLKDSQEANQHLRAYIDGILLNIVENYPQLLEVKQK